MDTHRSNAFVISLTLHAFLAAFIFFTTYIIAKNAADAPKIFELVAGPPTDIYATEAPKKGNTANQIKLEIPEPEEEPDSGGELVPAMEAVPEPEPTPAPKPVVKETPLIVPPKIPTKVAKTTPKPETKKTADPKTKPKTPAKVTSSYEEFLKKNPKMRNAKPLSASNSTGKKTANYKKVDVTGIAGGVVGGSANSKGGGGGKAMTRDEADRMDVYISFLVQEVQRLALEDSAGMSDELVSRVTFDISASGVVSNPRIARTSGNQEFDEFALSVFRRLRPMGPIPDGKGKTWTIGFTMKPDQ